jgi:ABC-2 type transport system permease protein
MSWTVVAKKDFRDAVRAKSLWALTALFVLFAGGLAYAYGATDLAGVSEEVTAIGFIGFLQTAGAILVPVIGLLVGYKAVVGERASGSLKLLLGLPHSRLNAVLGKLVGRTLVVAVPIVVGYLAAGVLGVVLFDTFAFVDFFAFTLLTVAFGLAYISIAVGFSSAMASESRAAALAIGLWIMFQFGWSILILLLRWALNGFSLPTSNPPAWMALLSLATPNGGYNLATLMFTPGSITTGYDAFYLQDWFGLVILAFWVVVPIGLGYWRFSGADL